MRVARFQSALYSCKIVRYAATTGSPRRKGRTTDVLAILQLLSNHFSRFTGLTDRSFAVLMAKDTRPKKICL
jgi:hypothetical protein